MTFADSGDRWPQAEKQLQLLLSLCVQMVHTSAMNMALANDGNDRHVE